MGRTSSNQAVRLMPRKIRPNTALNQRIGIWSGSASSFSIRLTMSCEQGGKAGQSRYDMT